MSLHRLPASRRIVCPEQLTARDERRFWSGMGHAYGLGLRSAGLLVFEEVVAPQGLERFLLKLDDWSQTTRTEILKEGGDRIPLLRLREVG